MSHVDAETGYTLIEPEAENVFEVFHNLRVVPVEVWLAYVEDVEIPLTLFAVCFANASPGATTENGWPVVWFFATEQTFAVAEDVHVSLR